MATACGPRPRATAPAAVADRIAIIVAERGASGARLVAIDEHGDRQLEVVQPADGLSRDTNPAVSPDGRWLVFASSRGRTLGETSVWIAPVRPEAQALPLTRGAWVDSHPVWMPDGSGIVFASTRDGGDYDLYRLAVEDGRARGEPEPLTSAPGHEVTPAIATDGTIIYTSITPGEAGQVESHLEERAPDGTIRRVTAGPADTSPALSPDGRTLVFARPKEHQGAPDTELWSMPRGGTTATLLVDLPLTDESGPVWTPDGRFVLATSVLRGAAGNVVFSSVIVIDLQARPIKARILQDRTGPIARLTPAITRVPLDVAALDADPEYLPALARIVAAAMATKTPPAPSP